MNPVFHDFWGSFVFLIAFVLLSLFNASMFILIIMIMLPIMKWLVSNNNVRIKRMVCVYLILNKTSTKGVGKVTTKVLCQLFRFCFCWFVLSWWFDTIAFPVNWMSCIFLHVLMIDLKHYFDHLFQFTIRKLRALVVLNSWRMMKHAHIFVPNPFVIIRKSVTATSSFFRIDSWPCTTLIEKLISLKLGRVSNPWRIYTL